MTSEKPREYYEDFKQRFSENRSNLENGVIKYHERYVSDETFGDHRKRQFKWYNKFYNRKGSYEDQLEDYRRTILQSYFNIFAMVVGSSFLYILVRR